MGLESSSPGQPSASETRHFPRRRCFCVPFRDPEMQPMCLHALPLREPCTAASDACARWGLQPRGRPACALLRGVSLPPSPRLAQGDVAHTTFNGPFCGIAHAGRTQSAQWRVQVPQSTRKPLVSLPASCLCVPNLPGISLQPDFSPMLGP